MPYLANNGVGVVKMEGVARIASPSKRTKSVYLSDVPPLDTNQTMITIGQVRVGLLERFHTVENVWVETIMLGCLWRVEAFVCPSPSFACAFNFTALASTAVENAFNIGIAFNLDSMGPLGL
mgnify:CR=1 FL=1